MSGIFISRVLKACLLIGRQKSKDYCDTFENYLLPFVAENHTEKWGFKKVMLLVTQAKKQRRGLQRLTCLLCRGLQESPDSNSIESLWNVLSRRVYARGRQLESAAALKCRVETELGKVGDQLRHNLVATRPKRCIAVLEGDGCGIKY